MTPSRILVVEDDRVVARDIQGQLSRIGHTVVGITARGEAVLPLALHLQPNLVLMDIRLEGDIDGIDAAQRIRERCGIPVVYLTAYADDQTLRRAGITEPFGFLLKPFESSQLRTAIEMALYKHATERKLRESERRYAVTLSSIGDAVIATDEKLLVTFMNPVAEMLTGWVGMEGIGRPLVEVFRIINEDTRQIIDNPASKVLHSGVVAGLANHTILLARDGREITIDDCGSPIIDDRGEIIGTVLVFRDTTQRRQTDAALHRAQAELERVAQQTLAATIAHEVSQPLTAVIASARSGLRTLEADPPDLEAARSAARHTVRDAQRAADVIVRIRSLFVKKNGLNESIDLNSVIHEVVTVARNEIYNGGVKLRLEMASDLPSVVGDRVQLQQVVLNLLTNAVQAMSTVDIRSRELLLRTQIDDGGQLLVTFRDSGVGIDPTKKERIFEAFYTTKSGGMGMGLWISRSIIQNHGGRLWVVSNDDLGATFLFTLPRRASGQANT
jgi:PAS domain S-box-containing protein